MNEETPTTIDHLEALTKYISTRAPEGIQDHYRVLLHEIHAQLHATTKQLFWMRMLVIALGLLYLTK